MAYLLGYKRKKDILTEKNQELVINSLHIGYYEGEQYDENTIFKGLNCNTGILFAKTDYSKNKLTGEYKTLIDPFIKREENGSFKIISKRGNEKGEVDLEFKEKCLVISTEDFLEFSTEEFREINYPQKEKFVPGKILYYSRFHKEIIEEDVDGINVIEISLEELNRLKTRYEFDNYEATEEFKDFQIDNYADPVVRFNPDNNKYYFMATTGDDGNRTLTIRESDTVNGLSESEIIPIRGESGFSYELGINNDDRKLLLWAPELHKIGDYWYCLFASGGEEWYGQCAYIMKNRTGDLTDKNAWEDGRKYLQKDGITELYPTGITLDMTYICDGEKHYVMWAGRETVERGGKGYGNSDLYIATIDPLMPWIITSDPILIATPEFGWEKRTTDVLEGPFSIKKDGKIYVTYSGSGVDDTYCVGCLVIESGKDLLKKENWKKLSAPLLFTENGGEKGPGHCSFTIDKDGNEIFIYHFFPGSYNSRSSRARKLTFNELGLPVLNN